MPPPRTRDEIGHRAPTVALLVSMTLISGCASSPRPTNPPPPLPSALADAPSVVAYGRYTLVELAPESAQHDLMQQIVDVTIPATVTATVGAALRYVLLRSGYRLCENQADTRALDALPLPAAHMRLGPLKLREALQILVGPLWQLNIDELMREVCFANPAHLGPVSSPSVHIFPLDGSIEASPALPSNPEKQR